MIQSPKWQQWLAFTFPHAEKLIYSEKSMRITTENTRAHITAENGVYWLELYDYTEQRTQFEPFAGCRKLAEAIRNESEKQAELLRLAAAISA